MYNDKCLISVKTFCKDDHIWAPLGNCGNINDPLAKYSLEPDSNQ